MYKPPKRRKLTPAERKAIYDKTGGHCAYCGVEIALKEMQVDHKISLYGHNGTDTFDNMLPACRSCNHYKSTYTLEDFREMLEKMPQRLTRDNVTYQIAVRFGLVKPEPRRIVFYFEKLSKDLRRTADNENSGSNFTHRW